MECILICEILEGLSLRLHVEGSQGQPFCTCEVLCVQAVHRLPMAALTPPALLNLKVIYETTLSSQCHGVLSQDIEPFEVIKECGRQIVGCCGVHLETLAIADLCAAIIQVQSMADQRSLAPDPRINHASLAPSKVERGLAHLPDGKSVEGRRQLQNDCLLSHQILSQWVCLACHFANVILAMTF